MRHLNYNRLQYFWTVSREGSIAVAAKQLHLTPQTISGQLKLLEESVGAPLFDRVGRGLVLTDTGRLVKEYADEIFSLGAELAQRIRGQAQDMSVLFTVGVVDSIPKLVAYRMLQPVLELDSPVRLVCHEGKLEQLLGELALHRLDMVLSDVALPAGAGLKAYNHSLGSSPVGLFAHKKQAKKYKKNFPQSLDGAPFMLPDSENAMRQGLEHWFQHVGILPRVVAEITDSALLKMFGAAGCGIFAAPVSISDEVEHMYDSSCIGIADDVFETYFAISPERKLKNIAVVRINELAPNWLQH